MPERTLDFLLAAGALLIVAAAITGSWPQRLLIAGALVVAGALVMAWSQQR